MTDLPILYNIIGILTIHFVADFILQTRWQAENKSKNMEALARHVIVYGLCFIIPCIILAAMRNPNPDNRPLWAFINTILHFVTDFFTSKLTAKNYNNGKPNKRFWIYIGLDQYIHSITLIATWIWLCQ